MIPKPPRQQYLDDRDEWRQAALRMLVFVATSITVTWALAADAGFDISQRMLCVEDLSDHLKEMYTDGFLCTRDYHMNLLTLVALTYKSEEELLQRIHQVQEHPETYGLRGRENEYLEKVSKTLETLRSVCKVSNEELRKYGLDPSASGSQLRLYANGPVYTFNFDT
ncbi:hypothetical protein AURDEDRAFT_169068 [Auricularia subglabra TFB-10046 SS5]|nr:hypothetical protein AURDEDRAFT_169068 [Auricularia subglabra TFB-10046 SS5]